MNIHLNKSKFNVPKTQLNERLGRLRKQYGFHLSELRNYIQLKTTI